MTNRLADHSIFFSFESEFKPFPAYFYKHTMILSYKYLTRFSPICPTQGTQQSRWKGDCHQQNSYSIYCKNWKHSFKLKKEFFLNAADNTQPCPYLSGAIFHPTLFLSCWNYYSQNQNLDLSFEVLPSVLPPIFATYGFHYPRSSSFTGNWFLLLFLFSLQQQLRATYFNSQKQHTYTNDTIGNRWLNNSFFEVAISILACHLPWG